jgi:hypothetical protein
MIPVVRNRRRFAGIATDAAIVTTSMIAKQPTMLTISVAHGNAIQPFDVVHSDTR